MGPAEIAKKIKKVYWVCLTSCQTPYFPFSFKISCLKKERIMKQWTRLQVHIHIPLISYLTYFVLSSSLLLYLVALLLSLAQFSPCESFSFSLSTQTPRHTVKDSSYNISKVQKYWFTLLATTLCLSLRINETYSYIFLSGPATVSLHYICFLPPNSSPVLPPPGLLRSKPDIPHSKLDLISRAAL